ncbi:MAG: phosphoadenylyl-sulfate reductase [Candidatus Magasanikbacteria bacterium]|nr:phosphoadenylyl-sulfate reductase [Candidatus Magasanikbacteria bacterium]
MNLEEKMELSRIVIQHALSNYEKIFTSCSFGKDSLVVADLAQGIKKDIQFIGIDTGYEFEETLEYADRVIKQREMNFFWAKPSMEDVERIDKEYGDSFLKNGQYKCCEMKLPAIEKHLSSYDAWITGIRRDETESRKTTKIFDQGKIVRVSPIAFWTEADVWGYIKDRGLEYHPLYDQGYKSLGCKPCTTEGTEKSGGGRQGQFERAGQ